MKIEVGKSYKTLGERKMTVFGRNPNAGEDSSQVFAAADSEGTFYSYFLNGNYTKDGGSILCLVGEWTEPGRVPLDANDIPPGSAVKRYDDWQWHIVLTIKDKGVDTSFQGLEYQQLMDHYEILYPGETEWKPCWKEV